MNGIEPELSGDYWVAVGAALNTEGNNGVLVEARDTLGRSGYDSASVTRDTQPPEIEITSPEDNATVETRTITVSGTERGLKSLLLNYSRLASTLSCGQRIGNCLALLASEYWGGEGLANRRSPQ